MIDRNEIFREVTLRLCSHLEIEEGLKDCIDYLAQHMPADCIYLQRYDPEQAAMRIVARARPGKCERMDVIIPFDVSAGAAMAKRRELFLSGEIRPVIMVNRPGEDPTTMYLLESLKEPRCSALILPLWIEEQAIGSLVLLAEGDDRFIEEHSQLYAMLKEPFFVALSNTLEHEKVVKLKDLLTDDNRYLHKELQQAAGKEVIGSEFGLKPVMNMARQVAPLDSPVLLLGETGVGKDVIANTIHYSSPRRDGPFIKVNSGAIPDTLIDSELFGHEKGAFSGALSMKRGRFERAHKGTIFLDEIGELPAPAQVRMLRVLQDKEIERVGGSKTVSVDIRIIAATNRDLEQMVQEGTFRKDLWFRLNVFPVLIPPLRDRRIDIAALVVHFVERKARDMRLAAIPELAPGAVDTLVAYEWPGNVRELENVVERALIMNPAGPLSFDSLVTMGRESPAPSSTGMGDPDDLNMDAAMVNHIQRVLDLTGGKIQGAGGAAEKMGMNASTLRARMRKLGISTK